MDSLTVGVEGAVAYVVIFFVYKDSSFCSVDCAICDGGIFGVDF